MKLLLKNNLFIKQAVTFYNKNHSAKKKIPQDVYQTCKDLHVPKAVKESVDLLTRRTF